MRNPRSARPARPIQDNQPADLLQTVAALQRELAQTRAERDEALARETATAEVLGVINSSPGDLAPVFDAMLEKAIRLCEAAFGTLWTRDGEMFQFAAQHGAPAELDKALRDLGPPQALESSALRRLAEGEAIVQFLDIAAESHPNTPGPRRLALINHGARTTLAVALRKDNELRGVFHVYRREVRPFTDKQIALLQNFAAQAVIAMENARLITETHEALEQQTATAEVLGVINASPSDLAPVFDTMLDKALRLCEAEVGTLWTFDGEQSHAVANRGAPPAYAAFLKQHTQRPALATSDVHISDMRESEVYRDGNPLARAAVDLGGVRTFLAVPLRKDERVIGRFSIYRQEVRPFSDKHIALLQNFAAQAVIAMENARLITETREALEQQTATAEVLGVINSSPGDLTPVFEAMLEKAMHLCGATFGSLQTFDGQNWHTSAIRGLPPAYAEFRKTNTQSFGPGTVLGRLHSGEGVAQIVDLKDADIYRNGEPNRRALVDLGGVRTVISVALRKDGKLLGAMSAYRQEVRPFTDKQIALLQNFAAQAVIAMENARLLGELRARTDEIAGWNKELEARVAAQLAEIERTGKLRRFLAPQLADLIVAQGDESILESHRREIVVVFCDLRGFTGFAERAEPEEVMALLADYHAAMGPIVASFEGTLDHYAGDGIMVFFNDPVPTPDPARRAIEMAVAMRAAAQDLLRSWRRRGHDIGFGVGISQGYATLGQIGFAERMDYTAIGTVTNLAARLCAEAADGQILVSRRVAIAVEDSARLEEIGDLSLKGLSQAVLVYNVPYRPA